MIKHFGVSILALSASLFAMEESFSEKDCELIEPTEVVFDQEIELKGSIEQEEIVPLKVDQDNKVDMIVKPPLVDSAIEELAELLVEEESQEKGLTPYEMLPITTVDKQKIGQILNTMANNNVFKLLFEKKRLERLGYEVNHVHPIRFLGTVFSDSRLVHCMFRIRSSGFKWDGFIDGFSDRLKQEVKAGNVNAYLPSFAEMLNVQVEDLQAYINYKDYEGLVLYLMEKKRRLQ